MIGFSFDNDLSRFEEQLAMQFREAIPDSLFVGELKQRLERSKIFQYRRELGAAVVASLAVLLVGTVSYGLASLIAKSKR